ncbi:hypothetical protein [Micavibrio aeruginosavorus]|uniref:hypothetical protein n=1 Tax=Micavibrio aeruginosavorus TaxID=349221 RepID=UPI003F4A945D
MSRISHADAPAMDDCGQRLYDAIWAQRPRAEVLGILLHDFQAAARVIDTPGYIQPGGFWTFKLAGVQGDNLIRLHIWPAGRPDRTNTEGIHDHVFDFTSLVLAGGAPMVNTVYTPLPDKDGPVSIYNVNYLDTKNVDVEKLRGRFMPVAQYQDHTSTGEYYTLKAGDFHTSVFENESFGVTLLATRLDPTIRCPRFFFDAHATPQMDQPRRPISVERRQMVAHLLQSLG